MATTSTAQALLAQLGAGPEQRAAAYAVLEATSDAELGASCVAALASVVGKPESEVSLAEHSRCSLLIAHLGSLDAVRVGAEFHKEMRCLAVDATGNALDVVLSDVERMTKKGARALAAGWAWRPAMQAKGWDAVVQPAGVNTFELLGADMNRDNAYNTIKKDDAKNARVLSLLFDLLREDRAELSAAEVAGAWFAARMLVTTSPHALHTVQESAVGLAIEELRTGSPTDWVSIERDPCGRYGAAVTFIQGIASALASEHKPLMAATPRLLDVFLDVIAAYESSANVDDANANTVTWGILGLYELHEALVDHSSANRTAVREAASGIRYTLDHPLVCMKDIGAGTSMAAVRASECILCTSAQVHRRLLTVSLRFCCRASWSRPYLAGTRTMARWSCASAT